MKPWKDLKAILKCVKYWKMLVDCVFLKIYIYIFRKIVYFLKIWVKQFDYASLQVKHK